MAGELSADASAHLHAAAAAYDAAYDAWQDFSRQLGYLSGQTSAEPLKELWRVPKRRRAGAAAIRRALRHEKAAATAARKAVQTLRQADDRC